MRSANLALVLALGLAACADDGGEPAPVKVGLLTPKSGALKPVGESFERVALTAVDSLNGKGGIDGRPIELLVTDTATGIDTVIADFQAMIDAGAIAVVGPATSDQVRAAWPVALVNAVPIISPSSTAPDLSRPATAGGPDDNGYMFRNVPDDEIQSIAMAHYLRFVRSPAVASVAILYENTSYGSGLKDAFTARYGTERGGQVQAAVAFPQDLADIAAARPAIDQLAALDPQPSLVVMVALAEDAAMLVNAWHNGGSPLIPGLEFFMTDGARSPGFLALAPDAVRGMCGAAPTYPNNGIAYAALKRAYEARYSDKIEDQVYAPNVWDAFHLIAAAAVEQKYLHREEDLSGPHLRDAITEVSRAGQIFHANQWRDLIFTIRRHFDVDYDGAAGPNDLDAQGQAIGPYEIWCISNDGTTFNQMMFLDAQAIASL